MALAPVAAAAPWRRVFFCAGILPGNPPGKGETAQNVLLRGQPVDQVLAFLATASLIGITGDALNFGVDFLLHGSLLSGWIIISKPNLPSEGASLTIGQGARDGEGGESGDRECSVDDGPS